MIRIGIILLPGTLFGFWYGSEPLLDGTKMFRSSKPGVSITEFFAGLVKVSGRAAFHTSTSVCGYPSYRTALQYIGLFGCVGFFFFCLKVNSPETGYGIN